MNIKIIKEQKFKNITISIRFRSILDEKTMPYKMILNDLLSNVSAKYPSKQAVVDRLYELYGASLSTNYITYGKSQVIELKAKLINPLFVSEDIDLVYEVLQLLHEFLYHPLLEDGSFVERFIEEAKHITISKIDRMIDEPSHYAAIMATKLAGVGTPFGIQMIDQKQQIQNLSKTELYRIYKQMIHHEWMDFLIVGDVDDHVESQIRELFTCTDAISPASAYTIEMHPKQAYYSEKRSISQSYIGMVYQTNISNKDKDYWTLQVANAVFGQTPSSLLFRVVREEHSLCYSIHSSLQPYDGALMVHVGVDPNRVDQTIDLIKLQFKRVCDGDFSNETLQTIKEMLCNILVNQMDDANGILNFEYRNVLLDQSYSVESIVNTIQSVQIEDVKRVFSHCTFKTTFVLQGEKQNEEDIQG